MTNYETTITIAIAGVAVALATIGPSLYSIVQKNKNRKIDPNKSNYLEKGLGKDTKFGYLREKDLNNNGLPERYVEIEGVKYFLMIDGKDIEGDILKGKNLEGKLRE